MATLNLAAAKSLVNASNSIDDATKETINRQLEDAVRTPPDTWVYRIVVVALGVAIFTPLFALKLEGTTAMQMVLPIATGALGALAGLLTPTGKG
jgi:hypothetical protein